GENFVRTEVSTSPTDLYRKGSDVKSSIVANGVLIEGRVESSVISRNATIEEVATVKNSAVGANWTVGGGAALGKVILDKDVTIAEDRKLVGSEDKPYIVAKRSTI